LTEEVYDQSTELFDMKEGFHIRGHMYDSRQAVNHLIIVIDDHAVAAIPCLADATC